MTAADACKNQPTFLKAVELQAVFASVLITLLAGKEDLEQRFPGIKNLFQYLIEVLEANQEPHKSTAAPPDPPKSAVAPSDPRKPNAAPVVPLDGCISNMAATSAAGLASSAAMAPNTKPSGDSRGDEYLELKLKNHVADLSSMKIMEWDMIKGLDEIKGELDDKMDHLRMLRVDEPFMMADTPQPEIGGALIHGEQGTCKTSLVYTFAQRHNLPVFVINGSIFGSLQGETVK